MGPQPLSLKPRLVTGTSLERFLAMQGCNLHLKQNLENERKNFCYMYGFAMPHFPPALVPTSSERSFFQFSRCSGGAAILCFFLYRLCSFFAMF